MDMTSAYKKGYRFERYIFSKLSESGFYCVRSSGSHGAFDIIAVYPNRIFGIQCKLNGQLTKKELSHIRLISYAYGIIPLLAYKDGRKTIIKRLDTNDVYDLKGFIHAVKKMEI